MNSYQLQQILMMAGIGLIVAGVGLALIAAYMYFKYNIPDIYADLSGKKRAEGKQYYVYMTAGMNKFLRIYYGRVKEYLASQAKPE